MPKKRKKSKSKLNEFVSTRVSVIAILMFTFVLGLFVMNKTIEVYGEMDQQRAFVGFFHKNFSKKGEKDCRNRGFEGNVQIHGWYENKDGSWVLRIAESDLKMLPLFEDSKEYKSKNSQIKIIDLTPELEQKLKVATKDNPVPVTITGFVHTCEGTPIACINYSKDKIMPYIK